MRGIRRCACVAALQSLLEVLSVSRPRSCEADSPSSSRPTGPRGAARGQALRRSRMTRGADPAPRQLLPWSKMNSLKAM
jgi:hypothetical protein